MTSTFTISTITIITQSGSISIFGILILLTFLVQKELANASESVRAKRLGKILNIAIIPLLIVFVQVVIFKIWGILH